MSPLDAKATRTVFSSPILALENFIMAGFNRFSGGGLNSLYPGIGGLGQGNLNNRRDDRLEDRRDGVRSGFFERRDDRDFGRLQRDSSPRRRRYSPDVSS